MPAAKQYLGYFQGPLDRAGRAPTSACCATLVPENRLRVYDVRAVIDTLADTGSRARAAAGVRGPGMVTALVRVEGRPLGVVANNPTHLGGAIDADAADKAARFLQLCDALRPPGPVPLRHAGLHGRARRPRRPRWCATSAGCS